MADRHLIAQLNTHFYTVEVVHGSLLEQEVEAVLLPTSSMLALTSPTARRFTQSLGKPYTDTKKCVLNSPQWRGIFPNGSVAMFPQLETGSPCKKIFCIATPHSQEGSTSDLASLGRTLDKGLHKIIFDEQVETLALPFIGSGKASAVAATAPFIIKQASMFLKIPHMPQSLKVMKIVEEDLSLCHSLAAAMQEHCLELVQYIDTGALVLPAKHQGQVVPTSALIRHASSHVKLSKSSDSQSSKQAAAASKQLCWQAKAVQDDDDDDQPGGHLKAYHVFAQASHTQQAHAASSAAAAATSHGTTAKDSVTDAKPQDTSTLQTAVQTQHGNSSDSRVTEQHVDALGPCLHRNSATNQPADKYPAPLSGHMPSRSPEDWLNQSGRQSHVEVIEVDEQKFLLKASAEGLVLERAFPADAKETRSLKVQSIADQIAAGLLAAGENLQAQAGLFEQRSGALEKLTGGFTSSTSPLQLNDRMPAHICGHESKGSEGDMALRAPRPPNKLTGPLPWDLLSESSEESLAPENNRHSLSVEGKEHKASPEGAAVQEAPLNAKDMLSAGIADQPATVLLAAGQHSPLHSVLKGHCAQDFEQPEQFISLPTEPSTLQNQTQAEHSEALLGTVFQTGASDRLHSSSHSQTAESTHLPSSMPQTEELEHLPSSDTNQTDSGGLSGTTVQPIGSTAVDSVGSRPQTKESNPLLNSVRPTAADNIVPISLPSAAETSVEHSAQPDIVHHSTERTRDSGTLASSTAQIDVVPTIESHTAGASTSSSSAPQKPGLGRLPDSASQKAHLGNLPSRASETATLGTLPYDIPKTAQSLPSCTSAAATPEMLSSSTAQRAASDTLLNFTAQMGSSRTLLGGANPVPPMEVTSAPTAELFTFPSANPHAAYSDTPTAALQVANTAAVSSTSSSPQAVHSISLPDSMPDVASDTGSAAAAVECGPISYLSNSDGDTDARTQNCISAGEVTAREADLAGSPAADRVHWADCNDFVFLKADTTSAARAPHHEFTDSKEGSVAADTAEEHAVRQFAERDLHGLTFVQRDAVDNAYASVKALQASSADKQQACLDLLQLHAHLPHLFLGFDMVYKSVKGLNGLDSCLASCAPSQESSGVFLDAASSSLSSATPSSPPSANPSRALSIGSAQRGGGLDVAAKLGVMSRFKAAFQGLYETALAAAEEASSGKTAEVNACRDAFEFPLAMLSLKEGKATDQLVTHQQLRSESSLSLLIASGNDSEGILVATDDLYGSFQVCDSADLQANDEGSPSLINRRPSLVGTLSDEELESLKILSGGIAVMMAQTRVTFTSQALMAY